MGASFLLLLHLFRLMDYNEVQGECMALDVQGLTQQIRMIGEQAAARFRQLLERRKAARAILSKHAHRGEVLRDKIKRASAVVPSIRCAIPLDEPLNAHYPLPTNAAPYYIIASDGSQIFPDRHAPLNYYLINIGTIVWKGRESLPIIRTRTHLFCDDNLVSAEMTASEMISMRRDVMEREALAQQVREIKAENGASSGSVVTLTDGTLALWGALDREDKSSQGVYRQALKSYLEALQILYDEHVISAAYIDKPRADWLVRSLEIAESEEFQTLSNGMLGGVTDEDLLANLLAPGERSAIFGIQAIFAEAYREELALHFFYLNVGSEGSPWLVRVEVPAWVAFNSTMLNVLHYGLWEQCRLMGTHPYPYLLHRAHEAATITQADKEQVELLLLREFAQRGLPVGYESHKQYLKNISKRKSKLSGGFR